MKMVILTEETLPGVLYEAVQVVKRGGVLVYPTDTVYGIGGDGLNPKVADKIIEIKKRPRNKGLILLVKDCAAARKYAYVDLWTEKVLEEFWPGPLTVVMHKKDVVPDMVAGGGVTIALRMPDAPFVSQLVKQADVPLISTAANASEGSEAPKNLDVFLKFLETSKIKPDLVIQAGELPSGKPSTILDLTDKKNPIILRHGVYSKSDLMKVLAHQIP